MLEIQNCTICYQNGTPAVSDVSLSVSEGEIVSIVGESQPLTGQKNIF